MLYMGFRQPQIPLQAFSTQRGLPRNVLSYNDFLTGKHLEMKVEGVSGERLITNERGQVAVGVSENRIYILGQNRTRREVSLPQTDLRLYPCGWSGMKLYFYGVYSIGKSKQYVWDASTEQVSQLENIPAFERCTTTPQGLLTYAPRFNSWDTVFTLFAPDWRVLHRWNLYHASEPTLVDNQYLVFTTHNKQESQMCLQIIDLKTYRLKSLASSRVFTGIVASPTKAVFYVSEYKKKHTRIYRVSLKTLQLKQLSIKPPRNSVWSLRDM